MIVAFRPDLAASRCALQDSLSLRPVRWMAFKVSHQAFMLMRFAP